MRCSIIANAFPTKFRDGSPLHVLQPTFAPLDAIPLSGVFFIFRVGRERTGQTVPSQGEKPGTMDMKCHSRMQATCERDVLQRPGRSLKARAPRWWCCRKLIVHAAFALYLLSASTWSVSSFYRTMGLDSHFFVFSNRLHALELTKIV